METSEINRKRATFVLGRIDEILSWDRAKEQEKDARFVELGEYLCEVRAQQYWRVEKLNSFEDFLQKRFADSRRKAYYLMAIHEKLNRIPKHDLQQVGWSKATELVKIARREGDKFDCATWLHKAKELPKEGFRCAVERHLTGKETEPWEIVYFKLYNSQLPVVERALEVAGRMLGTDKSRGYCLEMICADFLAGADIPELRPRASEFNEPSESKPRIACNCNLLQTSAEAHVRSAVSDGFPSKLMLLRVFRIALLVPRALHSIKPSLIPLMVRNGEALADLGANDAVELSCEVSSAGVEAVAVGHAPEAV